MQKNDSWARAHFSIYWSSYFLGVASLYFILNRGDYTILDWIHLFIHEPGHYLFATLGRFMGMLGGTLMQILLPLICIISFYRWKKKISVQLCLFWLAHSLINVSVYIDDANKMKLRIIGDIHDWNWILGKLNITGYATELGWFVFGLAIATFIFMIIIPKYMVESESLI